MTLTQIFAKVLNMSLTASLVIVLVIAARFVLRKSPKVFSYALWAVVLFRLLCPVSLPSPVSLLGLLDAPVAESDGITSRVEYVQTNAGGYREIIVQNPLRTELPDVPVPQQNQQADVQPQVKSVSAAEIITYIWIAGMAVLFLAGIGSYFRFRRHLTGACRLKGNVYLVDHIDSAFVAGLVFPRIYLPSDLPVKQMRYIIAHEQCHLKRFDHVSKHLAFAALCIHWFNPLVWAAFILSGKDMEMSCDEAVIKKLGEGIRADYSASLLTLAMGHHIIAGSPLAFGEGDTKGRIKNMANWKQPKKWVSALSFAVCAVILTACAANPEKNVVVSKNDGSFDVNVVQSATKPAESQDTPADETVQYTNSFTSTDGSVEFTIDIDEEIAVLPMPVAEVTPHYLTAEDARNIATALFGSEAVFYEAEPSKNERFSKEEIIDQISRWSPYTSAEGMSLLFPNKDLNACASYAETMQDCITYLSTEFLNSDVEDYKRPLCQWQFHNSSYYKDRTTDLDSNTSFQENEQISAWTPIGNGMYSVFRADRRDKADYKLNNVYVTAAAGGPLGIDHKIFCAENLRTSAPTQEQISTVVERAQRMVNNMGLGSWEVGSAHVEENNMGNCTEYRILVDAFPVLEGVMALERPQLNNLKSKEIYASNYYLTEANFSFSAGGELVDFTLYSPIDITQIVNKNAKTLTLEELLTRAKEQLSYSDAYQYGGIFEGMQEDVTCAVQIAQIDCGLTRVKAPNTDNTYYYVPAIMLVGDVEYCIKNTGEMFFFNENVPLLMLNAVDGTVIPLGNE